MKSILLSSFVSTALVFTSCTKVNYKNATVIKDCTGSYLRINEKDYHICNDETVENYQSGEEVTASFKKIENCSNDTLIVCELYHQNEGWIEVTEVK